MAIEILAPAGDDAALRAAVFSGADAVYLGLTQLSARRTAGNFTREQLEWAVPFCHARGVKVYVAVNTTIWPGELEIAAEAIRTAAGAGADALIVQDLAVAELAKQIAPGLELHGSTQMSVHTLVGAKKLAEMGFTRVVLARELSMPEIEHITKNAGIEIEVFVHGALCVSVSGQCYMSAFLGGRSGNRGSCAGPCRLPFAADGSGKAHLSLKDLSAVADLPKLSQIGVASAKIEGRLRGPEYVAAAVTACRKSLAGEKYDAKVLEDVFSRSGFTNAYIEGKISGRMFGVRTAQDAAASKAVMPSLRELYRREMPRVPVDFTVLFDPEGVKLTARDRNGNFAAAYSESEPKPAQKPQDEAIRRALAKTGGTPFELGEIRFECPDGIQPGFLPGSEWNEMRRSALEGLLKKRERLMPIPCKTAQMPEPQNHETKKILPIRARFERWEQVPQTFLPKLAGIILPIIEAEKVPQVLRSKTILELPRAMFGKREALVKKQIEVTRTMGFAGYLCQNIAHLELAKGLPMYGGFGLNISNPMAAQEYAKLGLKAMTILPELPVAEMEHIAPEAETWALCYGHMPLMMTRSCPLLNVTDCTRCKQRGGTLTDRKNRKFEVRCSGGVRQIYNPVPLYMGERLDEMPVDAGIAMFTIEDREQVAQALDTLLAGRPWPGEFTRGLYYKNVQ